MKTKETFDCFNTLPSRVNPYVTLRQRQRFRFGIPALQTSKCDVLTLIKLKRTYINIEKF